jgi:histidinol dehydrogenase
MIEIISSKDKITQIRNRAVQNLELAENRVRPVIKEVRTFGDKALIKYTKKFDSFTLTKNTIEITKKEIKEAYQKVDKKTIRALKEAASLITQFAEQQIPKPWFKELKKGIKAGQLIRPLERVGCYIPGGNYQLPTTILMTVIPAKVAGVKEVIICSPPKPKNYVMYVASDIAGADRVFRVGGSQAISAMAYGTSTIPKVDKIVGPGNIFVTAAKKLIYGDVGLDFLAGPSEILVLAEKGNPKYIAADMLSQAEHDRMASAILITNIKKLADDVQTEINKQLNQLKTKSIAQESLRKYCAIILVKNLDEAVDFANEFAPEHLELIVKENRKKRIINAIRSAGAIFINDYSCESAGDYCIGNHVLPTGGGARFTSGLSVKDFIKTPTIQELSRKGLASIKSTIKTLAEIEGLDAHKKAVEMRFRK